MNMSETDINQIITLLQQQMQGSSPQAQLIISSITALAIIFLTLLKIYKSHSKSCEAKKQLVEEQKQELQQTTRNRSETEAIIPDSKRV